MRHCKALFNLSYNHKAYTDNFSALEVGQLVKDEYFTLFDSIGALEVGSQHAIATPSRLIQDVDYGPKDGQWLSAARRNT